MVFHLQSPVKAQLYAQLDSSAQPKSVVVAPTKTKKLRHRRVGSGTLASPKSSPSRDRRYQSEPETRSVKFVDTMTQTDAMDISETDGGPSPYLAQRELMVIRLQSNDAHQNHNSLANNEMQRSQNQENSSPTSPNGNTMSTSDITYHDACSSPDLLDDAMNSNERLEIRECSDDDHLETLGRKVNDLLSENRLSIRSNHSDNGNLNETDQTYSTKKRSLLNNCDKTDSKTTTSNRCGMDINNCESRDEFCDDSWTDEEGEDPEYNYSLRRKR